MKNIENKIYAALILTCEEKEHEGIYRGNGHHLAQALTIKVSEALLSPERKKIYEELAKTPETAASIALRCNKSSKHISSQLLQMNATTSLVGYKKVGKNKLWYKYN